MIARLSLLLLCKNINVSHYSKSIEGIDTKLKTLAHHDKMQLHVKGHNSESYIFGVMLLFNFIFLSRMIVPDRRALVPHVVLLFINPIFNIEIQFFS